jgi:hypothetical protein
MRENTKLWDMLGRTDPAHTKGFTRGGGFKGTAIKPMWSYRRMTEEFGPCGTGWGVNEPSFQVVPGTDGEMLVYCTASIWYGDRANVCYGVGGDKVVNKFSSGLKSDDEAFKKAFTDAVTNALKLIGVGADVHMGLFDDSKYVSAMREEFSEEPAKPNTVTGPAKRTSSAQLKRDGVWPEMMREIEECQTVVRLMKVRQTLSDKALNDKWPVAWCESAAEEFDKAEKRLTEATRRQVESDDDTFPGDLPSNVKPFVNTLGAS